MSVVVLASLSMLAIAGIFAVCLGLANLKLQVNKDPRVVKAREMLAGVDCGGCGYPSCNAYAEAVVFDGASVALCSAGGAETVKALADLMGIEPPVVSNRVAVVHCGATEQTRKRRGRYFGIRTCLAAHSTTGGDVVCSYGCLGLGDCVSVCPFDAIHMVKGSPVVDPDKCTACGKCVAACPRKLIAIHDYDPAKGLVAVVCSSRDRGPEVKKVCEVGCIACKVCEKQGPEGLFKVQDNLSVMNYEFYTDADACQAAIEKCPTHCIRVVNTRKA